MNVDNLGRYVSLYNHCFGMEVTFDVIDDRVRLLSPEGPLSPYLTMDDALSVIIAMGSATFHWFPTLDPELRETQLYDSFKEGVGVLSREFA